MKEHLRRLLRVQYLRFLIVGGISALADLLVNTLLAEIGSLHPVWANLVSRPVGGAVSFTLNKMWTFRSMDWETAHAQALKYLGLWLTCYVCSSVLIGFYHDVAGLRPILSKIAGEATLGLFSFFVQKYWTFR
jgi:putative flippase GtrA